MQMDNVILSDLLTLCCRDEGVQVREALKSFAFNWS